MDTKNSVPLLVEVPSDKSVLDTEKRLGKWDLIRSRADWLLSYVILACGLCTVLVGATQIITSHSVVPLWDEWQEIDTIAAAPHHQPSLSWIWAQHSEHRVAFYRLLLLANIHVFHGNQWIFFFAMLVVQSLFLVTLAWLVHFEGVRGTLWRAVVGLGAFALFCPSQWENFGWAFQISFLLPGFLACLALAAVLRNDRFISGVSTSRVYMALSIAAAFLATYSNANGVVLWPLLILVSIASRRGRYLSLAYFGFGVACLALYLHGYAAPSYHSSPLNSLTHPLSVLQYTAGYLGVIFPAWVKTRDLLAVLSGAFGLLLAVAGAVWVLPGKRRAPLQVALLGLVFFAVATALMTALGRVGFGLEQAFSSRYQTFNLLFWFSVVSVLLLALDEIKSFLRTLVLAAIAVVMLLAFIVFPLGLKASRTRTQQAEAAATALLAQVPDQNALRVLYIDPSLVWRDGEYFRQQRLFMFSEPANRQLGQPLSSVFPIASPGQCRGEVSMAERLRPEDLLTDQEAGAVRVSGWGVNWPSNSPVRKLIIAAEGKVIGYAASLAGPFTAKHSDLVRKPSSGEWLGFARPLTGSTSIDVYAMNDDARTICHLTTASLPAR